MKKLRCKKCDYEICLGIDDEERSFTCCGQSMVEIESCWNTDPGTAKPMVAEQLCKDFTGSLVESPGKII